MPTPPKYSLKYRNPKLYKQEMEQYHINKKVWESFALEPVSDAEIETLKEYTELKRREKRNGKKNSQEK